MTGTCSVWNGIATVGSNGTVVELQSISYCSQQYKSVRHSRKVPDISVRFQIYLEFLDEFSWESTKSNVYVTPSGGNRAGEWGDRQEYRQTDGQVGGRTDVKEPVGAFRDLYESCYWPLRVTCSHFLNSKYCISILQGESQYLNILYYTAPHFRPRRPRYCCSPIYSHSHWTLPAACFY